MKLILPVEEIMHKNRQLVGGKGYALARLAKSGFRIPETVCISVDAYREFVNQTGLLEQIQLELHRKDFKEMRWEEIWDCATRIRNMFLRKQLPGQLSKLLRAEIEPRFGDLPVAVRSSAPDEDTARASFAGLHESYINVSGVDAILEHIRMVWASLWSDAALLYRQEIGLNVDKSTMAVVIQAIVNGDRSGVVFTRNPNDASQGVIESVHGLNQGLVDGSVEPDQWIVDRRTRRIVSHTPAKRSSWVVPVDQGVRLDPLTRKPGPQAPAQRRRDRRGIQSGARGRRFLWRAPGC